MCVPSAGLDPFKRLTIIWPNSEALNVKHILFPFALPLLLLIFLLERMDDQYHPTCPGILPFPVTFNMNHRETLNTRESGKFTYDFLPRYMCFGHLDRPQGQVRSTWVHKSASSQEGCCWVASARDQRRSRRIDTVNKSAKDRSATKGLAQEGAVTKKSIFTKDY